MFGPKPAAPGKGGPPSAPSSPPEPEIKTPFQQLIDDGQEFILGPPHGVNKASGGGHRNSIIPKLGNRIDVYAKKLREYYYREGIIHDQTPILQALRRRQPEDTLEKLIENKECGAVINARDEFDDVDLVFPQKIPYFITRNEHSYVRPFLVRVDEEEEIRVTVNEISHHFSRRFPYFMNLQRYIVGRPNLICLPIYPVQEDKSLHFQAGAGFKYLVKELYVWCYLDKYPARIEVDCSFLSPNYSIKIGDVEKLLPYGIYLHKQYDHQKNRSVVKLKGSNLYMQRKNALIEQEEAIQEQRKKMSTSVLGQKKDQSDKVQKVKKVPIVSQSSKFIMAEKKEKDKEMEKKLKEQQAAAKKK